LSTLDSLKSLDSISAHVIKYGIYRDVRILEEFLELVPARSDFEKFTLNESKKEIIFFLFKSHILGQMPALSEIYLSIGISKSTAHRSLNDLCHTGLIERVADAGDLRRTLYVASDQIRHVLEDFLARYRQEFFLLLPQLDENSEKLAHGDPDAISRLVLNADTPIMIYTDDGTVMAISKQWLNLTGYTSAELATIDDWLTRAYGQNADRIARNIRERFEDHTGCLQELQTILTASGEPRLWRYLHCLLGRDKENRQVVMSVVEDVTETI
jgi:PAS domain S-box-containing protein